MERPAFARFRSLAGRGNVLPVWLELSADCLTPVLAYLLTGARSRRSFLLESVEGGETVARYSFLGRDPQRVLTARGTALTDREGRCLKRESGDFLEYLRGIFRSLHPVAVPGLPRFTGGAVGYIGYEAARLFEPVGAGLPHKPASWPAIPDAEFALYDTVLAFDHPRQVIVVVTSVMTERDGRRLRRQHDAALARLERLAARLVSRSIPGRARAGPRVVPVSRDGGGRPPRSNLTRRAYAKMVATAKKRIRAGDIYQAVLAQRFEKRLVTDPFSVYRELRRINPSPYMYFLRGGEISLAGASPEMLVRVEGNRASLHPIAGTRPGGRDPEEDAAMAAGLLADEKERAEHVMLVDLGRNDLGRICAAGSVKVSEFMAVERYSHVMHLVTRLEGKLARGKDAFDALRCAFPAGTVSGAPKVRAMQIIEELEPTPRGPYAGAVCYIDYSGNLDSCIVLRTMVAVGRQAYVQAGAGIVADSDPLREYQETVGKAQAVIAAIEGARAWAR